MTKITLYLFIGVIGFFPLVFFPLGIIMSDTGNPLHYWGRPGLGDCLVHGREIQSWEKDRKPEYQILRVGSDSYLVRDLYNGNEATISMRYARIWLKKTGCLNDN